MNEQIITEIINRLNTLEQRINAIEGKATLPVQKETKNLSIREFILSKHPKDEIQKTLLICYYIESNMNIPFFNVKDIESGFRQAKEKLPRNINYNVFMNIKKGYLMESNEKKDNLKSWSLTNSGIRFLEADFKDE